MNYTDNYTLKLPSSEGEFSDVADINDLNENFIVIDSELVKKADKEENEYIETIGKENKELRIINDDLILDNIMMQMQIDDLILAQLI